MDKKYDKMNNKKEASYYIGIEQSAKGIQIQQNVSNSIQKQKINDSFDHEKALEVLDIILCFEPMFEKTYGCEKGRVLSLLNGAKQATQNKEKSSKIKNILNDIKDISLGVTSSLIATEILSLLSRIGI